MQMREIFCSYDSSKAQKTCRRICGSRFFIIIISLLLFLLQNVHRVRIEAQTALLADGVDALVLGVVL